MQVGFVAAPRGPCTAQGGCSFRCTACEGVPVQLAVVGQHSPLGRFIMNTSTQHAASSVWWPRQMPVAFQVQACFAACHHMKPPFSEASPHLHTSRQVDPSLSRTVLVSTKLDTRIPQFATPADVETHLQAAGVAGEASMLGSSPFFT